MGLGDDAKGLAELIVRRSSVKGQVTKFKNYLDKLSRLETFATMQQAELTLKLSKFESLSSKFDDLQSQIEVLNSSSLEDELEERENIEQDFIDNIVFAKNLLQMHSKDDSMQELNNSQCSAQCHLDHTEMGFKLPLIQIAKFDGSYFRWLEFRDTFKSLVHENSRISPVNKFHYLISYLDGEAARVISNLEVSSNNYQEAWKLLLERYDNKRLLISHHLSSLFNLQSNTKETDRSLRFTVDHVTKNLRALSSLGQATDHWDVIVIHLVSSKLDNNTLMKWEEHRNTLTHELPTLKEFLKFLYDRADVLESLHRNKVDNASYSKPFNQPSRQTAPNNKTERAHTKSYACTNINPQRNSPKSYPCPSCKAEHRIYDCPSFKAKGVNERIAEVSNLKLCTNCLRSGHTVRECQLGPCRECKKRHNTLLHIPVTSDNAAGSSSPTETLVTYSKQGANQALLSTALIEVVNPKTNKSEKVRALLDCGSQSSFLSQNLRQKLSLHPCLIRSTNIVGFGNNPSGTITESCTALIKSPSTSFSVTSNFYVVRQLTGVLPNAYVDPATIKIPKDLILADPKYYQPSEVDVLIGADLFWNLIGCEQRSLGPNCPKLHSSKLGWLIAGPLPFTTQTINSHHVAIAESLPDENLEYNLHKFWELEEIPQKTHLTDSEQACESHFLQHTYRLANGRFCVKLPLIDSPDCLGDSYNMAKKRFMHLEKRFKRQPEVKTQYVEFIKEYALLGHLSEVSNFQPSHNQSYCYLPHHPVFKENSETTKIRVVFDASARTSSGLSVNDIQMIGPQLQDSLFSILVRARLYKYILTGDVEKMYRQILVDESDRDLQLILWREDEHLPIKTLRLNTVTYGFASASYLSTRCLWQLGEECEDPVAKTIIQHDSYVDDIICGTNSETELANIKKSITEALKKGCFTLRKFRSNLPSILESCPSNTENTFSISESSSALGLGWDSTTDHLRFSIEIPPQTDKTTKRYILSTSFKIFDPLGLVSPCIIIPKLILQQLWLDKVDWDETISQETDKAWRKFSSSISALSSITIPRQVLCDSPIIIELHSFGDSSQRAYGACLYIRSIDRAGNCSVNLLCSKSKVAPVKATTIPRLELCAALLAARLCKTVIDSLRFPIERKVHWSDSSVVLTWLQTSSRRLKTFVANRVSEILELTDHSSWRYVPTSDNPADLISRGVYPDEIQNLTLWWSGPEFLSQDESLWPILNSKCESEDDIPELKSISAIVKEPLIQFHNFSKLNKLKRIYAYVQRFLHNLKNPHAKQLGSLTMHELQNSFHTLCRVAQLESFPSEYDTLTTNKPLSSKSSILSLTPFMDTNGLIRVGGRLDASSLSFDNKHPILLNSSHHLTKLIFEREHVRNLHAGPQLLLACVRQTIWPINGRHLARRTVHNCMRCRRVQGKTLTPMMGNLPSQRVTVDFPFRTVGVDFAGPFFILNRKGRGSQVIKCYLCIFVCLRYKCLHLEAVSDLSKDAFILTLRRFISRRGKPTSVFCDNGKNFVATAKEIGNFIKENHQTITDFAAEEEIKFVFSPSYAPHFGGIWEAGVKSAKFHIRRVMGNTHLTFEELSTLFAQVEAILNSRPLCPLSSSPNDLQFLTPGHFLIGRPLTALPSPCYEDSKEGQLQRFARMEQIRQHFWRRWQKEYLAELQQRTKWRTNTTALNVGDMVLIHEENLPPLCWRLGRISRLFPGPDGVSRVADVQTTQGYYRRPLTRLCPLPATDHLIEG